MATTQIFELKCLGCGYVTPPPVVGLTDRFTMDELIRLKTTCPQCKEEDARWVAIR